MTHDTALVGLALSLLGTLIVSTWRFASLATKLSATVQRLEDKEKEQDIRLRNLDLIPGFDIRIAHLEKHHSLIPKAMSRLEVLEAHAQHSKEMRQVLRQSWPGPREDE